MKVEGFLADAERVDLIESGGHHAARATSSERISRLAEIVFRGFEDRMRQIWSGESA